ncbi:oligoendopeptidase F [Bacteroidota bacterium]
MKKFRLKIKKSYALFLFVFVFQCISIVMVNGQKERSEIPEQYTWNLNDMYESDEAWNLHKDELLSKLDQIVDFKGKLSNSADDLHSCLDFESSLAKDAFRLFAYASMKSDEDTRVSNYLSMRQELMQAFNTYAAKSSFIEPEIVAMEWSSIENFMQEKQELREYEMYLGDLHRKKAHKLSEKEEKIMADAGLISGNSGSIYRTFTNAEMPYPTIELTDGTEVTLNKAAFSKYRAAENRADREKVFQSFWSANEKFRATYGEMLYGNVKNDVFRARARNYGSSLQSALDANNIPVEVYHSLIENVNNNLETFHRYLKIKKRMLGVDTLKYSDLYAPTVKGVDLTYNFDEAREIVLDAVKPLGEEYVRVVNRAFNERWIDVYPSKGKRSGGYSGGVYGVHPFILLNYNDMYEDVGVVAHELGHSLHSYFSNKNQPYPTADYSIFVAEVSSTFNEALLIDKMLGDIENNDTRLALLMSYLDGFKGTLIRQTQFAEFELKIHESVENGTPLTGDLLTEMYEGILKKYFGHEQGVCLIDDLVTMEWAMIPHFYYNFYVYQYATSYTASLALAEKVLNNEEGARESYLKFLSAGGSEYPIDVLKTAGVDMTTSEPFEKSMDAINKIMDEIEKILADK